MFELTKSRRVRGLWRPQNIFIGFLALIVICTFLISFGMAKAQQPTIKLLVDTDPGVDDAAAIVWLLKQQSFPVEVLGFSTVVGNTTVDNATNNLLTLLEALDQEEIPVVMGAAEPLNQTNSRTSSLIHGPDGFWFVGLQNPHDLSDIPNDVAGYYCTMANDHPEATILTLGPLTNLATAIQQCPDTMHNFSQIISVGGSKQANAPLTDYNIWQDPEAADIVLTAGIPITLLTLEGSEQLTINDKDLANLAKTDDQAVQLLIQPLQLYFSAQTGFDGAAEAPIYDAVAAIYAMNTSLGESQSALVKMVTEPSLARGQTIIGLTFSERLTMIASDEELSSLADQVFIDPNFDLEAALGAILFREPDNAQVVLDIEQDKMHSLFMREMKR
jgi:purine nucleosidase